jgi:uncharacterized protein DUF6880/Ku-like protein
VVIGDDLTALVDRLRRDQRRNPYQGRREYAEVARSLSEACEELIAFGGAAQTVPVLRKAVDRMTRALMYMDDSSGIIGDELQKILAQYARACAAAPPKPAALADWLVTLAVDGPGWPPIRLRDFAPALGDRGLAEVAELVEKRAQTADPQSWALTFAVRDLREQIAEVSGDLDRYVAVLAENLNSAIQYERITIALRAAGRDPEAIMWARRGLADKPGWPHAERLRDTLVDLLRGAGDIAAAVQVRRDGFQRHPTATTYRALAATGADDPAPWALPILHDRVVEQPPYAGELVEVLLLLGRDEEAWQTGQEHQPRLGHHLWLRLLEKRRTTHPADTITPYQEVIEQHILNSSDKQRYGRAIELLPALREAWTAAGRPKAFPAYLTELRTRHSRRPTFLKKLDAAGWRVADRPSG